MLRRILDSPWLYFTLAALLLIVAILSQLEIRFAPRHKGTIDDIARLRERKDLNVVWVVIDTLRADHLSGYGYGRSTSPVMDRFAAGGASFTDVEAQSTWTKASMASLWTSLWPIQTGILRWDQSLSEKVRMPAEALKDAGFRTAGIYRNGWLGTKFGFGQGFDTYYIPGTDIPAGFERHSPSAYPLKGSDGDITESVFEFLRNYRNERFFLYLHMMDVHQYAYDVSTPVYGTAYMDSYDSAINWVDHNVGVIEKALDDAKLLDRTVLVISSDHGEAFREHGQNGHGRTLYSETTRVPLILSFPFLLPKGVVVNELIRNLDVWPTIFDLLGLPPMEGSVGRSLLPLIEAAGRGQATVPDPPPPAFAQLDRTWGAAEQKPYPIVSVKKGGWKLIHSGNSKDPEELYDENNDPGDRENLANDQGAARAELESLISWYLALPIGPWGMPKKVEVDKEQLEQLRALGYVVK